MWILINEVWLYFNFNLILIIFNIHFKMLKPKTDAKKSLV